ncbi:spore germination protein GerKB [Gracilibacillus boraciitolerans JCM 21714]|uniref:Spore germination protein GerKB n=1 Tax=Gracilibacillus boraciitolerans JCM 21714 TaxID=1298598 RepID=W4VNY1_9BACI|nr:GerAB/ArcD/ProY family transporter [Gracilibacillus boraciitolerans]GAE94444.1 spore germination protein GerKB [Gracilibacillus boraciitolerans JCM 21714]
MNKISNIQLFSLILVFEIGSTTLFALGIGADRNAWIVVLISYLLSFILLWTYTQIPRYYPNQNFSEILIDSLGVILAKPLLMLYGIYFFSQTTHNFYEFGVLIRITALPNTPLLVILYLFIAVMVYILHKGMETVARTIEILAPYFILFLMLIYFLTFISEDFQLSNLQPILANGYKPILKELPSVIAFPFGELVVFLIFWHYINKQHLIRRTTFIAVTISTLFIITSLIVFLAILGPEFTSRSEIPLLETLLSIHIAMIFTNLDSIGVFIMFIGGFYKTALHFFGFSLALTWLFNRSNPKWVITIFGLLLPIITQYRFSSLDDQRWKGMEGGVYAILLYSLLPILVLFIIMIKKKAKY